MKNKLSLKSLKVTSFVTNIDAHDLQKLRGGADLSIDISKLPTMPCNCSQVDACVTAQACGLTN